MTIKSKPHSAMSERESAMSELRRMLDKRGVEWKARASYDGSTKYDTIVEGYWFHEFNGKITIHGLSPEQAIAATLGRKKCKLTKAFVSPDEDGYWWRCSECGVTIYNKPTWTRTRFCPNCGAEVDE